MLTACSRAGSAAASLAGGGAAAGCEVGDTGGCSVSATGTGSGDFTIGMGTDGTTLTVTYATAQARNMEERPNTATCYMFKRPPPYFSLYYMQPRVACGLLSHPVSCMFAVDTEARQSQLAGR